MTPTRQGSFRLFRFLGIDVHVHWSWFVVAFYSISTRTNSYSSPVWTVAEYLSLFLIVLLHEFGHSLACRQVGGQADQIVLWPLGGVAYVAPPPRPGATLWSIAAGPLVNLALMPVVLIALWVSARGDGALNWPDLHAFIRALVFVNGGLLVFNLLPVYPLDGGQILRSLLWFPLGRGRSLLIATVVGMVGVAGLVGLAMWAKELWLGVIGVFLLLNCWKSFNFARALLSAERDEGRPGQL